MANRNNTFILKRSNVVGKIPVLSGLTLGELALNTADAKLYTLYTGGFSGATEVREIGWDRLSISGGTLYGNLNVLGSVSATTYYGDGSNLTGISGFTDYYVTGGTYSNGTLTLNRQNGSITIPGFPSSSGSSNYYGSFSDSTNQQVIAANTPTAWSANTTEISNGIYIVDGSKITVSNDGVYEIGYSAQIEKTTGVGADVTIWAKLNGNNIDRSSSTITLENNSVYSLPFVSYILDLYAGDYVEFYFSSPSNHVQLTTLSGLVSPTRPDSPSLIIVAKAIGNAVIGTSGDTYVTGLALNGDTLQLSQNRIGIYSGFSVNLPFLPLTGGTITGPLSAPTYYGDGSNLTGISRGGGGGAGGQLYYFNISNTQSPYYEFSTTPTTATTEQSITSAVTANSTALIGGFMTPSNVPNITNFPAGILSFYLHCYGSTTNHTFDTYAQVYKRSTGGTETLLFTSDPSAVVGTTTTMVITDGFFSGVTLNSTDRLVTKVFATNLTNQTRDFTLVSESSQHYSFALTTIPSYSDNYVTGGTYSNGTLTLDRQNGSVSISGFLSADTYVTGFTFNTSNYDLTILQNNGLPSLTQNLGILAGDITVTGGTYNSGNGVATFYNNVGGSFQVPGFLTGFTDIYLNSGSFNSTTGDLTLTRTDSVNVVVTGFTDYYVTGGTYSNGTLTLNRQNGSVSISGLSTGYTLTSSAINTTLGYTPLSAYTDTYLTGGTYSDTNGILTLNNQDSSITVSGFSTTTLGKVIGVTQMMYF